MVRIRRTMLRCVLVRDPRRWGHRRVGCFVMMGMRVYHPQYGAANAANSVLSRFLCAARLGALWMRTDSRATLLDRGSRGAIAHSREKPQRVPSRRVLPQPAWCRHHSDIMARNGIQDAALSASAASERRLRPLARPFVLALLCVVWGSQHWCVEHCADSS